MEPWWKDRLDRLRRDERPAEDRPVLQLPKPPEAEPPSEGDKEPERGIAVIDFTF